MSKTDAAMLAADTYATLYAQDEDPYWIEALTTTVAMIRSGTLVDPVDWIAGTVAAHKEET